MVVGNKKDMRTDELSILHFKETNEKPVSPHEGETLAKSIGASGYVECAAAYGKGQVSVFRVAATCARDRHKIFYIFTWITVTSLLEKIGTFYYSLVSIIPTWLEEERSHS